MKKLLSCLLVVFILLINVVPCYASSPALSIGVSSYYVDVEKEITVNINLSSDSNLGTLDFTVNFNPSEFEYVAGSGKSSGVFGENETFVPSNSGYISFQGDSLESVTRGGTVLTFKLKPLSNGGMISLSASASDIEGNSVAVTKSSVKFNCSHSNMIKKETIQEATCMLYGRDLYMCTTPNCTHTETREVEPNDNNHSVIEAKVTQEPTCTKTGIKVGKCTDCGMEGAPEIIKVNGHEFSDWKVTKEPTDTTLGIKERTCKVCKEKETQMISPTGDIQDEPSTDEITTDAPVVEPTDPTTEPDYNGYFEIETEPTTEDNGLVGKLFGDDVKGSNVALVAITGLTVLIVGFLIAYLVLLRKKK